MFGDCWLLGTYQCQKDFWAKRKKNKNKKDEEEENPPSWNTFPECLSLLKTDKAWTEQMFPPKSRCGDVTFPGRKCGGVYY